MHFTANVRLTRSPIEIPRMISTPAPADWLTVNASDIYRIYFHGPAYRVLESVQLSENQAVGLMVASLPPNTQPAEAADIMCPRLIELCLQTAGVWELKNKGILALPTAIGSVTVYRAPDRVEEGERSRLLALVQTPDNGDRFDAQVVDESGNIYLALTGYRTVKLPTAVPVQ